MSCDLLVTSSVPFFFIDHKELCQYKKGKYEETTQYTFKGKVQRFVKTCE